MENYDLHKQYELSSGESVDIVIDEDDTSIIVLSKSGEIIGRIKLTEYEDGYYITWMYMDELSVKYKRQGIGRASLVFFKKTYRTTLYAASDDGARRPDGSHLTGDAPAFITKMKEERVVESTVSKLS